MSNLFLDGRASALCEGPHEHVPQGECKGKAEVPGETGDAGEVEASKDSQGHPALGCGILQVFWRPLLFL